MPVAAEHPLAAWESFYVIVGSSAAALTGLQFVVIALIAESDRRSSSKEIAAFGTPTIVHFCAALLVSAVVSAPWERLPSAGLVLGTAGLAGIVYVAVVIRRARRQGGYAPVFEDWVWHTILPALAYAGLLAAGIVLERHASPALFAIGAATLLLLFIGIHNAWDTVTFIATERWLPSRESVRSTSTPAPTARGDARGTRRSDRRRARAGPP